MSIKNSFGILLLSAAFVLTGCDDQSKTQTSSTASATNNEKTRTVQHEQGVTNIPLHPQKVVVINTQTLDTMDALGVNIVGVPKSSVKLPVFLAKYEQDQYTNVGTLFEPNYELLSSLKPDLIMAGGRSADAYGKLSEIAPTISVAVDPKNMVSSMKSVTIELGEIFDKKPQADALVQQFEQKIEQVKKHVNPNDTALVIMINGGKMAAYGPGTRFGFIYDALGFKPATTFAQAGKHGNVMNAEMLLTVNPDWLFVLDRDSAIGNTKAESAQQVLDNALVHKTKVWNNNHIVYLDSSSMYLAGGIQTYMQLLDQVEQVLTNAKDD
ncbi:siderophore ABC transporter substrate-binding protein [Orbaceae bacterium ac157xtp]